MRKTLLVMIAVLAAGGMGLFGLVDTGFAHEGNHSSGHADTLENIQNPIDVMHNGTHIFVTDLDKQQSHQAVKLFHVNGTYVGQFGSFSNNRNAPGEYYDPSYMAHNGTHIFVTDHTRVMVFSQDGTYQSQFGGTKGISPSNYTEFTLPKDIAVDDKHVFVVAGGNNHILIYNLDGTYAGHIGTPGLRSPYDGNFSDLSGIAINGTHVLTVDTFPRIQAFTYFGNFAGKFASYGFGDGELNSPRQIAIVDAHILVTDRDNHRVQIFHPNGEYVDQFGTFGSGDGQFRHPESIAHNGTHIFVTESTNPRVQLFEWSASPAPPNNGTNPDPPATVPGAPTNLTASDGTPAHSAVNLDWDAPSDDGGSTITDYILSLGMDCLGCDIDIEWQPYTDPISNATSAMVTDLSNATKYWFQVAAVNSVGRGAYSQAINHTTSDMPVRPPSNGTDPTPPDPPRLIRAEFGEGRYLQVEYSESVVAASGAYTHVEFDDAIRDIPGRPYSGNIHHLNYAGELVRTDRTGNIATLGIDPTKIYRPTDEQQVFSNRTSTIPVNNPYPPPNPILPPQPDPPQDLDELIAAVADLQTTMSSFEALLSGMNARVTNLQNAVTGINSTMTRMDSTMADQGARMTALEERVDVLSAANGTNPNPPVNGTNPDPPDIGSLADAIETLQTTVTDLVSRVVALEHSSPPEPEPPESTGVHGNVFRDVNSNGTLDSGEPGIPGRTVIAVNTADHSDAERTDTDSTGYYSFDLSPGGYLVQVIGGGSQGYAYVTVSEGEMLVLNLIP